MGCVNVTNMLYAFTNSNFNKDISQWDVSNVTNMEHMFRMSKFVKILVHGMFLM